MEKTLISDLIWGPRNFFHRFTSTDSQTMFQAITLCNFKETNGLNLRKWQKTQFRARFWPVWSKFGPQNCFAWILPLFDVTHCCKLSSYAISRKSNEPNLRKWQETQFWAQFWPVLDQIWSLKVFLWVYFYYKLYIVASYHFMQFKGKLMNQS